MASGNRIQGTPTRRVIDVCLGDAATKVGALTFVKQGRREFSQFAYSGDWLRAPERFAISPDLPLDAGHQTRRSGRIEDSVFHFALADTAPDAWGRRVIDRAHARRRRNDPGLAPLTELDYLCAVDDFSRVGALRLCRDGQYLSSGEEGRRRTPPLLELQQLYAATRAVETSTETAEDLRYLQGKGTSLGGMRPKCTVLDENEVLSIAKFPSVGDTINVTRGEVLALRLAKLANIDVAHARCVSLDATPVALVTRFDRVTDQRRIPYMSGASLLQASRIEERAYTEIVDAMRRSNADPDADSAQLWRRLVFNLLITNTDDHLQNIGFLYAGNRQWKLAPAFDLNPMPGKLRESKTWLTEDSGPIESIDMLMEAHPYFALTKPQALHALKEVVDAVQRWRDVAVMQDVGLQSKELKDFESAFEHSEMDAARALLV